jgi:hypothetical protein
MENHLINCKKLEKRLKPNDRWLALRSGLLRPAVVSKRPTSAEFQFTKDLKEYIETVHEMPLESADFNQKFLEEWNNAVYLMMVGDMLELHIGHLTITSCERVLENYRKQQHVQASYSAGGLRVEDSKYREELRALKPSIQEARAPAAPTGKVSARALVAPAAGAVVEAAGVVKPRPVRVHRCDKCNHRARGDGEFEHKGHIGWIGPRSGPVATFCVVPLERKLQSKWLSLPKMTRSRYRGKHAQLSDEECMEKYDRECVEKDITL